MRVITRCEASSAAYLGLVRELSAAASGAACGSAMCCDVINTSPFLCMTQLSIADAPSRPDRGNALTRAN